MANVFRIQMMDHFAIYINEQVSDELVTKSKKGSALIQYLLKETDLTEAQAANADIDENGRINAADLTLLKRMLLGS